MRWKRVVAIGVAVVVVAGVGCVAILSHLTRDPIAPLYDEHCAVCHGDELQGAAQGPALVGVPLRYGDTVDAMERVIRDGLGDGALMPAWKVTLDEGQIRNLAIFVGERREGFDMSDLKMDAVLALPEGRIESERHAFRIEPVAEGLHPWPFSIAPLPDGRILVTEKTQGLRIVTPGGGPPELALGTPPAHDDTFSIGTLIGTGWLLDVALHPDYASNGWIYLHFGDRCEDCDTSMNKLVRAHLDGTRWVDEETIWQADPSTYNGTPETGAGGRIAFDDRGHVFMSIGIKGPRNYVGPQDLALPYGKILRLHDDGRVPDDNPFVGQAGALSAIWTYGHRSPQGLEYDAVTGRLWSTEMGPRGGDELNLLLPGRNYGWPLTSKGIDYDGTPVEYGKELGIELDLAAIEQPVLDLTPAPAISSFVIYHGSAFPGWEGDVIAGTLKDTALHRFELDGERVVHRETLLDDLARIRDVETAPDGTLLLLLEHASGARIVRLVPEETVR